jgi:hypothetical protein
VGFIGQSPIFVTNSIVIYTNNLNAYRFRSPLLTKNFLLFHIVYYDVSVQSIIIKFL